MAIAELPSWLATEERYEPAGARHRVMQKNVLHLASLLERVRLGGGAHEGGSMVDRALSCVSAPVRLVGMFVCVLCVCLTQSPLYLMLMAAIALVLVAVRPARGLRATFVPALGAAGLAVVLALPALLLGASATGAMLKIALKTFINEGLERDLEHGARGRRAQQQGRQCQNYREPRSAERRHKGRTQPARGAHRDQHQRDSRHQHQVQRTLRQTHAQDADEHPHQAHRSRNARKGAVDHRPALVRASTQANPLKQARQVQDILLHHTMPSPRGLVSLLGRKPARQLGYRHEHRFP